MAQQITRVNRPRMQTKELHTDLHRHWEKPVELDELFNLGPTISRSRIRFIREGLEGRITGYEEVSPPSKKIRPRANVCTVYRS